MAAFKDAIDTAAIAKIAEHIQVVYPEFPAGAFAQACAGLDDLELKGRVQHVARALRASLPADWPTAARILVDALPPASTPEVSLSGGFWLWPLLQVVEDHGRDPAVSLPALREMTSRFSAEFAIRPLIDGFPDETWPVLEAWVTDPDPHVRRLVSEGSRPRLPWGRRLAASVADPRRGLALLDRLVDDPDPYVRRSVANHLGDVAKDHPELAVAVARRWMPREALVRHALRSLLKAGDPAALAIFFPDASVAVTDLAVTPVVAVGEKAEVTATLLVNAPAHVRVDVVWSWPGARGWSSRTMRGEDRELAAGEPWKFRYRLSTRPVTTRPTRPGIHRIHLRVLGVDTDPVTFELVA